MRFIGNIEDGKLKLLSQDKFFEQVKKLEGKEITLEIKKKRNAGSDRQRKYFHAVILEKVQIALCLNNLEEAKGVVKYLWKIESTEDLDSAQREKLYSEVRVWLSVEYGVFCPLPNEEDLKDNVCLHE